MKIHVDRVKEKVCEGFLRMNCRLSRDVVDALHNAQKTEQSPIGKGILTDLLNNMEIAREENCPICQDTGMAIVFVKLGQQVELIGGNLYEAIQQGVRDAYRLGYFRNSVVADPLQRTNTGDNTPAIIHLELVPGEELECTLTAKGFGSENMSGLKMLNPSQGRQGVMDFVTEVVQKAGPNACPPFFVGVGIGGTMEVCALLAKKALMRSLKDQNPNPYYQAMEEELLERLNQLGIGPMGMGGTNTVLAVQIETFPTHIAGLPVAVNMCCHVNRHETIQIRGDEVHG